MCRLTASPPNPRQSRGERRTPNWQFVIGLPRSLQSQPPDDFRRRIARQLMTRDKAVAHQGVAGLQLRAWARHHVGWRQAEQFSFSGLTPPVPPCGPSGKGGPPL
jgi:hypothetical protein